MPSRNGRRLLVGAHANKAGATAEDGYKTSLPPYSAIIEAVLESGIPSRTSRKRSAYDQNHALSALSARRRPSLSDRRYTHPRSPAPQVS